MKHVWLFSAIILVALVAARPVATMAQSFEDIAVRAEAGDADSQYQMGRAYEIGEGVSPDDFEAVRWLRLAAAQDHPEAALDLGWMLANGYGVPKDLEQAYFWFVRAAALGAEGATDQRDGLSRSLTAEQQNRINREALADLPSDIVAAAPPPSLVAVSDPVLQPEDSYETLRDQLNNGGTFASLGKLRLLAQDGDARASNLVGLALRRSIDPRDRLAGMDWLLLAARSGLPAAQYNLAVALREQADPRAGQVMDHAAALRWLQAAETGIRLAGNDYAALTREFAARAGIKDPYRAAVQGSVGAYDELRELIRLERQALVARQALDQTLRRRNPASGKIETLIIE